MHNWWLVQTVLEGWHLKYLQVHRTSQFLNFSDPTPKFSRCGLWVAFSWWLIDKIQYKYITLWWKGKKWFLIFFIFQTHYFNPSKMLHSDTADFIHTRRKHHACCLWQCYYMEVGSCQVNRISPMTHDKYVPNLNMEQEPSHNQRKICWYRGTENMTEKNSVKWFELSQ